MRVEEALAAVGTALREWRAWKALGALSKGAAGSEPQRERLETFGTRGQVHPEEGARKGGAMRVDPPALQIKRGELVGVDRDICGGCRYRGTRIFSHQQ